MLNLAGWCDITYSLKQVTRFRVISFQCGYIPSLYFVHPFKSFIALYYLTHYFKVNWKTNHLAIIDKQIYIKVYISTCYTFIVCYYYVYVHAIKSIVIRTKNKINDETSDNDCLCLLNIFCWDKWLVSLINWVQKGNLKKFSDVNKYFGGVLFIPNFNAFSLQRCLEWAPLECSSFLAFFWKFW